MDRQAPIQVCQSQIGAQPVSLQSPSRRLHRKTVTIADVTACGYLSPFQRPQVAASWNEKVSYSARAATALGDMTSPILAATEEHPGTGSQSFAVYRLGIVRVLLLAATKLRTAPADDPHQKSDSLFAQIGNLLMRFALAIREHAIDHSRNRAIRRGNPVVDLIFFDQ